MGREGRNWLLGRRWRERRGVGFLSILSFVGFPHPWVLRELMGGKSGRERLKMMMICTGGAMNKDEGEHEDEDLCSRRSTNWRE